MPLYLFYTMVQKSQKWPKTQIKGGGVSFIVQIQQSQSIELKCWHHRQISLTSV